MGNSGLGKTTFAIALLKELGLETLIACNLEDLTKLTSNHKAVLFDDIHFTNLDEAKFLSLIQI
ncbi:hypothetical protein COCOBI_pt-0890 (chloroplast) [Coccomyxa sp. Obi]|nr:hypothetical protein COCOBI_pt-0890 [Coccomyxa sp. Obi]